MATVSVVWRRLDGPGHDVCRVDRHGSGWRLEGSAAFIADDLPAMLAYTLDCDN
jgi:hypothetical protein